MKDLTVLDVYPDLRTTEDMLNLLNKHPHMIEDGIPLSIVTDLTDETVSISHLMVLILNAISDRLSTVDICVYKLGLANIDKLKDLGYTVGLTNPEDLNMYSISGWSEYE